MPTPVATLGAVFFVAIAVHGAMDVFGGGVHARPWEARSNRGVYNHLTGRWIRPRRWIRYAGAPEDLGLAAVVGLPVLVWTGGRTRFVIAGLLLCSIGFSLYRRRFAVLDEHVATDA